MPEPVPAPSGGTVVGAGPDADDLADAQHPAWDALLVRALAGEGVRAVFQPIVDVRRRVVAGYESLTRFDLVRAVGPDRWFAAAAVRNLVPELESATLRATLAHRADLPPNCFLTLNVEPESLMSPVVMGMLDRLGGLGGLAIEITEHRPLPAPADLDPVLDRLRSAGALIAVDDAGAGYAGLEQILRLRPSIIKLDRALVDGLDRDPAKSALVEMLGLFANRVDAWLLAEGVENVGEARQLEELGVPLAQGFLYARPGAPWAGIDTAVLHELRSVDDAPASGLHRLVQPVPPTAEVDLDAARRSLGRAGRDDLRVIVDDRRRPLGLLTPDGALTGSLVDALKVNVHTSPTDVAHRLATRQPVDTSSPVVVTDNAGRYLGLVPVARLLDHLARTASV